MRHVALLAAVLLAGAAQAGDAGSKRTRDYVAAAGQADMFETLEATAALTESHDPQVRDFAQRMIAEHGQTTQALRQASAKDGLAPPPMGIGADQAPLLGALQGVRGADFDRTYWRHQALAHRSALVTTQAYAADGDDPAVRGAAAAAVPIIAAHLAMAERMAARPDDAKGN